MQVILKTSGGFVAGIRRPEQMVDTNALSTGDADELARLVDQACAAEAHEAGARSVPDGMTYTITVRRSSGVTVLTDADASMSPAFRALLDWVRSNTR